MKGMQIANTFLGRCRRSTAGTQASYEGRLAGAGLSFSNTTVQISEPGEAAKSHPFMGEYCRSHQIQSGHKLLFRISLSTDTDLRHTT